MPQLINKKIFVFFLNFFLIFSSNYNLAFAQTSGYDYTKAGVGDQIKQFLCAPTEQNGTSNSANSSGSVEYAGQNNQASGDLYNCINRMYKFAIVIAAVVGVFFIVIAGYLYMGAGGNQESVDKAKDILATTITSIVILFAGYILLKAINPDLIQFRSIQPPSVRLQTANSPSGALSGSGTGGNSYKIAGYNIGAYATASNHETVVNQIYSSLQNVDFSSAGAIDLYLKRVRSSTPITGSMVTSAASKYNVDSKLMVALMQTDSSLGTAGKGMYTCNPGNVGNTDSGATQNFCPSWQRGVEAVAEWLSKHRS